jgi:hypothetical protein
MEKCVYCGSEASFLLNDRPVCLECDALGNTPEGDDFDEQSEVQRIPPGNVQLSDHERSAAG